MSTQTAFRPVITHTVATRKRLWGVYRVELDSQQAPSSSGHWSADEALATKESNILLLMIYRAFLLANARVDGRKKVSNYRA